MIKAPPVALFLGLMGAACSAAPVPSSPPPRAHPPPAAPALPAPEASPPFDPVPFGLSVDGAKRLCDDHLKLAEAALESIKQLAKAPPEQLTFDSTLGRFDDALLEIDDATDFLSVMGLAHPDAAVRAAAKLCEAKSGRFKTAMYLDDDIAAAIKRYTDKHETPATPERARFAVEVLRELHRRGLDLPDDKQQRIRELDDEILKLGQEFMGNIAADVGKIEIKEAQLDGLPDDYKARHPAKNGKVEITTNSADYDAFVTYAKDRKAALDLYVLHTNRGGEENVRKLDKILRLRNEKAKLIGYSTWAAYALDAKMAKTESAVRAFLDRTRAAVKETAKAEVIELSKEQVRAGGRSSDRITSALAPFLFERAKRAKFNLDERELAKYFEVEAVTKGVLDVTGRLFGIEWRPVEARTWHEDVKGYDVIAGGAPIGRVYLDLYGRENKFKYTAAFPARTGKKLANGSVQLPMAVLLANFPKPGGGAPALLEHDDVVTLFHEIGHVLHHVLGRPELAAHASLEVPRDFIEAPAQVFEELAWSRDVLDTFARHVESKAKIPDDVFAALAGSRRFGRGVETEHQAFLALLDLDYHTKEPGFDTTKLLIELQTTVDAYGYVGKTHYQSSFGHLITYDAGYYGYLWAESLSRDLLTRFQKEGLADPKPWAAFRDEVLAKGASEDPRTMMARFLGREPNLDAFAAYLGG